MRPEDRPLTELQAIVSPMPSCSILPQPILVTEY